MCDCCLWFSFFFFTAPEESASCMDLEAVGLPPAFQLWDAAHPLTHKDLRCLFVGYFCLHCVHVESISPHILPNVFPKNLLWSTSPTLARTCIMLRRPLTTANGAQGSMLSLRTWIFIFSGCLVSCGAHQLCPFFNFTPRGFMERILCDGGLATQFWMRLEDGRLLLGDWDLFHLLMFGLGSGLRLRIYSTPHNISAFWTRF